MKRITIGVRRDHYAIEEIFTSANMTVFSSYRGETRSLEYAPTGVVNSRYD